MSNIFDWDEEEEEKKSEAEVSGAYPLAQPPNAAVSSPSEPPALLTDGTANQPSEPDLLEIDTVIRPRAEPWQQDPSYQQAPQETWADYPPDAFDRTPAQPGVWSEYKPDSPEETARQGGLAWSAGIVFFSSVGFMLFLGWIADWLFASSPWGLILGIVLGSIIGFVQFFRISSRIFGPSKSDVAERPLMPRDDKPV